MKDVSPLEEAVVSPSPQEQEIERPEEPPGEEQKKVIVPKGPMDPTAAEIAEHEASGHVSHRSWCIHCMRARGNTQPHFQVSRASGDGIPTLQMDYFYLSSADKPEEEDAMPHLVVRCDKTRRTWATALPQKATHAFNINWLCSVVREAGWKKMIMLSDNENAIKALKQEVVEAMKDLEITLQESPTENPASNGAAECAVREVKRMIRAILSELETKLGKQIDPRHSVLAWIARRAALLLTRFRVGEDGESAY